MTRALVLTYHAVQDGPAPLCIDPALFARHLDCVVESGARALTVAALADGLDSDVLSERAVVLTFDDGLASTARVAAPLLAERGLVATVFCVAGRLGGRSDWPSPPPRDLPLATADELSELADAGWEIGSHGVGHVPLGGLTSERVRDELAGSKQLLEEAVGRTISSFAYPYGIVPTSGTSAVRGVGYAAACTARPAFVIRSDDPLALPRVDAHYLRRPSLLRAALSGRLGPYLGMRRVGARARKLVRADFVTTEPSL